MSYDFQLFELPAGMDLQAALDFREQQNLQRLQGAANEAGHMEKSRAIAAALVQHNPRLQQSGAGRFLHLDTGADGNGIEITLAEDEVGIGIPYWHSGPAIRVVFREIWGYLRIIHQMTGYVIYDPQFGRLIALDTDFQQVVDVYSNTINRIQDIFGS